MSHTEGSILAAYGDKIAVLDMQECYVHVCLVFPNVFSDLRAERYFANYDDVAAAIDESGSQLDSDYAEFVARANIDAKYAASLVSLYTRECNSDETLAQWLAGYFSIDIASGIGIARRVESFVQATSNQQPVTEGNKTMTTARITRAKLLRDNQDRIAMLENVNTFYCKYRVWLDRDKVFDDLSSVKSFKTLGDIADAMHLVRSGNVAAQVHLSENDVLGIMHTFGVWVGSNRPTTRALVEFVAHHFNCSLAAAEGITQHIESITCPIHKGAAETIAQKYADRVSRVEYVYYSNSTIVPYFWVELSACKRFSNSLGARAMSFETLSDMEAALLAVIDTADPDNHTVMGAPVTLAVSNVETAIDVDYYASGYNDADLGDNPLYDESNIERARDLEHAIAIYEYVCGYADYLIELAELMTEDARKALCAYHAKIARATDNDAHSNGQIL